MKNRIYLSSVSEQFALFQVVHTERSSEENWYKSLVGQIDSMKNNIAGRLLVNLSPSGRRLRQFLSNAREKT